MKIYLNSSNQNENPYSYAGTNEKAQMERLVAAVHEKLKAYDCVSYINTARYIADKAAEAARLGCDVSIAHHSNAGGGRGTVAFYHPDQPRGKSLARRLVNAVDAINPGPHTNSKIVNGMAAFGGDGYGDVREPAQRRVVGILFEVAFHDNPTEARWIVENIDLIAAAEVAAIVVEYDLKLKSEPPGTTGGGGEAPRGTLYRVQVGAFKERANADKTEAKLKAAGYETYMVQVDGLYKVQTGAFKEKPNAERRADELKAKGFDVYITTQAGRPADPRQTTSHQEIKVGDIVRVRKGAMSYDDVRMYDFVYERKYRIDSIDGNRVLLDENGLCTAFRLSDLIKV